MKSIKNGKNEKINTSLMNVGYKAERSIEDEIERQSHADLGIVVMSYVIMFVYILIALGEIDVKNILLEAKITLGLIGVVVVLLSVAASIGFFSWLLYFFDQGVVGTLIIVEVIPFLILAVGVDNIFILVQAYQVRINA